MISSGQLDQKYISRLKMSLIHLNSFLAIALICKYFKFWVSFNKNLTGTVTDLFVGISHHPVYFVLLALCCHLLFVLWISHWEKLYSDAHSHLDNCKHFKLYHLFNTCHSQCCGVHCIDQRSSKKEQWPNSADRNQHYKTALPLVMHLLQKVNWCIFS